MTTTSAKRS